MMFSCPERRSEKPKPLQSPQVGGRLVQKELSCVQLWDPVVTIEIRLLQDTPPNVDGKTYYDYKLHATALGDPSVLACNKFEISECTSIGNVLPDLAVFCKACAKARPDICKFYESGH